MWPQLWPLVLVVILDPARALGLPAGRELREASRQAQAVGIAGARRRRRPRARTATSGTRSRRASRQSSRTSNGGSSGSLNVSTSLPSREEAAGLGFSAPRSRQSAPRSWSGCFRITGGAESAPISSISSWQHAGHLARPQVSGMVFEDDPESIAWVTNRGFEESGRQVELSRELPSAEPEPSAPDGIELAELDESRHEEAYAVWAECYPDMPVSPPIPAPTYEEWLQEEVSGPSPSSRSTPDVSSAPPRCWSASTGWRSTA